MDPDFVAQAQALVDAGKHQDAVKVCRLGLLSKPSAVEGRVILAKALHALGRLEDVLSELRIALDMNPKQVAALTLRGEVMLAKGQLRSALDSFVQASELAPGDAAIATWIQKAQAAISGPGPSGAAGEPAGNAPPPRTGAISLPPATTAMPSVPPMPVHGAAGGPPPRPSLPPAAMGRPTVGVSVPPPPPKHTIPPPLPKSGPSVPSGPSAPVAVPSAALPEPVVAADPPRLPPKNSAAPRSAPAPAVSAPVASPAKRGRPSVAPPTSAPMSRAMAAGDSGEIVLPASQSAPVASTPASSERQAPQKAAAPARAAKPWQLRRVSSRPAMLGAAAVLALLAGMVVGLAVRHIRVRAQVGALDANAIAAMKLDTYQGWVVARDAFQLATKVSSSAARRTGRMTAEIVLASEYRVPENELRLKTLLSELGDLPKSETAVARALAAVVLGDPDTAELAIGDLAPSDRAWRDYLRGRVAEMKGDWRAAAEAYVATGAEARTLAALRLADVLARRELFDAARSKVDAVLTGEPMHPRANLVAIEIKLRSGQFGADAKAMEQAEQTLARLVHQTDKRSPLLLSPGEVEDAEVARAWLQLMRGERKLAAAALASLAATQVSSWEGALRRSALLAYAERYPVAAEVLESAIKRWPAVPVLRLEAAKLYVTMADYKRAAEALGAPVDPERRAEVLLTRARIALAQGDHVTAARDSDAAAISDPEFLAALAFRAEIDLAQGDPGRAQARLMLPFQTTPTVRLGLVYAKALSAGNEKERARDVLFGLTKGSGSGEAWLALARLERNMGRIEQAKEAYRSAVLALGTTEARLELATLDAELGNIVATRDTLTALGQDTNDGRVLAEAARYHTVLGGLARAEALLAKAAGAEAPDSIVARERGRLAMRWRKRDDALSELTRAVSLAPSDAEAAMLLIDAHLLFGADVSSAKTVAVQLGSNTALGNVAAGKLAVFDGDTGKARTLLLAAEQMLASDGHPALRAETQFWLGYLAVDAGDKGGAARLDKALAIDPSHLGALNLLGSLAAQNGDFKAATARYEKVVEYDPEGANNWFVLGEAYLAAGERVRAEECLTTALRKDPGGDFALKAYEHLQTLKAP